MNFRLTYDGPLKAAGQSDTRRLEKHEIRRALSRQLDRLFMSRQDTFDAEFDSISDINELRVVRGKIPFLALVRERLNLVCDLDILFLRRENPGGLIGGGGDLDNRIKVLFDALRIPQDDNELRGVTPELNDKGAPRLMFCLAEDDKLITGFRVTTDRLLEPAATEAQENDVRLIINVEVKATKLTEQNMAYFSHF